MSKIKKLLALVMFASMLALTACGPSEEQLKELEDLREEVNSISTEVTELKSQNTELERNKIAAEQQAKECNEKREQTQQNLKKMGK